MTKTLHGKVRGRTIELDEDLGILEGQEVEVHDVFLDTVGLLAVWNNQDQWHAKADTV
ncbi:MAG TPA: hypothetical protein VJ783_29520 [Pirellulales bacterium]|nr:hypothetical protein [Pirellulales bacterium]